MRGAVVPLQNDKTSMKNGFVSLQNDKTSMRGAVVPLQLCRIWELQVWWCEWSETRVGGNYLLSFPPTRLVFANGVLCELISAACPTNGR